MSRRLSFLVSLFLMVPALHAAPPTEKIHPDDEKLLKSAKVAIEASALLDYFRKRTTTAKEREKINSLVRLLGDDSFKVREQASDDLLALGISALPQLRVALNDPDEEIRTRAREGIEAIQSRLNPALTAAIVRVLRVKALPDTVKTLLEFLPDAESEAVTEEVLTTLAVLGVKENKVDPLLVDALKDKLPARRAAAAMVLGRSGTAEQRKTVQALLTDPEVRVRFRAAQGLLAARDRAAIPIFIALLSDAPPELATRAEELLSCIAGARTLRMPISDNVQQNRAVRSAWEQWWKQNAKIDLSRADVDLPRFNASLQARETARLFAAAVLAGDKDKLDKLIEAPFYCIGEQTLLKREQINQYLSGVMQNMVNQGITVPPVVGGTMTVDEYLKTLPQPQAQQLIQMRRNDVRVVLMQWPQNPNLNRVNLGTVGTGQSALFVRIVGDQPQILGGCFGAGNLMPNVIER